MRTLSKLFLPMKMRYYFFVGWILGINKKLSLFGYYDKPDGKPKYDPGFRVPCLICKSKLNLDIKTISLMRMGDDKSYFYRVHKKCYEDLTQEQIGLLESELIDSGWITQEVECSICGKVWQAVYPAQADKLECPACNYMNDRLTSV